MTFLEIKKKNVWNMSGTKNVPRKNVDRIKKNTRVILCDIFGNFSTYQTLLFFRCEDCGT